MSPFSWCSCLVLLSAHTTIKLGDMRCWKPTSNQLLGAQLIMEICSPYTSPSDLVKKKDASLCMCVDYHQLNSKTRKNTFPYPCIEESLDALSGACRFSLWMWLVDIIRSLSLRGISLRLPFAPHLAFSSGAECYLGSAMPLHILATHGSVICWPAVSVVIAVLDIVMALWFSLPL